MAAPTNISFLTATDLTSIPQTITQRADDSGTTYDLYFRVPGLLVTSEMLELGIFGFGDLTTYHPISTFWLGPAASPTRIVSAGSDIPLGTNIPIQVPVDAANEYFIKIATNGGNPSPANLTLLVQAAPNDSVRMNDIVIPDDTVGFPVCVLDGTQDYTVRRFVHPFSSSEQGDLLRTSGKALMHRDPNSPYALDKLALFDSTYALESLIGFTPAIGNTPPVIRANQTSQKWWVAYFNDPTLYAFSIDADGTLSTVENLGNGYFSPAGVGTSPDESILYFSDGATIFAWDLVNHVALPDFAASIAGFGNIDILTLSNGEVVAGYYKATATKAFNVKHYSTAGAILHTYTFGSDIGTSTSPRLAYSVDNLTSFYVYIARDSGGANRGKSNAYKVKISDGTLLTSRTFSQYNVGQDTEAPTATPLSYFGVSSSCPFWVAGVTVTERSGIYYLTGTGVGNPTQRHDTLWIDASVGTTEDVKIP